MGLETEISNNWKLLESTGMDAKRELPSLRNTPYPALAIRAKYSYGVAVPYHGRLGEYFARFTSVVIQLAEIVSQGKAEFYLILTTSNPKMASSFSVLCAEFVYPGAGGTARKQLEADPSDWCEKWKTLLGNKDVDDMAYDVLGELCVLRALFENSKHPEWNGPLGDTYDIDCTGEFYEVKSTLVRTHREITVHSHFQLDPPTGTLTIAFCQFEPATVGLSINTLVRALVRLGYDESELNLKLENAGYPIGLESRNKHFLLHAILCYAVDETFPRITERSFVGGVLPEGISTIVYTVSLDDITPKAILHDPEP